MLKPKIAVVNLSYGMKDPSSEEKSEQGKRKGGASGEFTKNEIA
jgi:hypothetical protein